MSIWYLGHSHNDDDADIGIAGNYRYQENVLEDITCKLSSTASVTPNILGTENCVRFGRIFFQSYPQLESQGANLTMEIILR